MRTIWIGISLVLVLSIASDAVLAASESQPALQEEVIEPGAETAGNSDAFGTDQLEQLVAPIALYPDALLTQILMASTYPLEVVEADRFMKQNPDLKDDALNQALLDKDWDPSVKSLCALPDVLKSMSENLDWTQDMGDALLSQKAELMDTVQRMRGKAHEAGNLKTTEQQVVTRQEDKIIVIESSDPEVVYVPQYSSTVVYGGWGYPSWYYPPFYYPPPPGYGFMSFTAGVIVGGAIWGNCHWGWGGTDIDIDIDRYNQFNRETNRNVDRDRIDRGSGRDGKASWQHDPSHRKGVNYRSQEVAQRHGATRGSSRVTRDQARGRATPSTGNRLAGGSAQARDRAASYPSQRIGHPDRSAGLRNVQPSRSRVSSAYSGSRTPSIDRMSSSRGALSRGATSFAGSRGGGFRGRR
jgi:hypothetical protein